MTDILDLSPDWIITPGTRVCERRARSRLARSAASAKRIKQLRQARMLMEQGARKARAGL